MPLTKPICQLVELANRAVSPILVLDQSTQSFTFERIESQGFSGSVILRMKNQLGEYAIRSWPNNASSLPKIQFWRSVNRCGGKASPFPQLHPWPSTQGETQWLFPMDDCLWSICDWVAGRPVQIADVSPELIEHLATQLGALHRLTLSASETQPNALSMARMISPSLDERRQRIESLDTAICASLPKSEFFCAFPELERLTNCVADLITHRQEYLRFTEICSQTKRKCHWIVRDLWHENILLHEDLSFASIVDIGAARLDWPGLDFTRLIGSLIGLYSIKAPLLNRIELDRIWRQAHTAYVAAHPQNHIDSLEECMMLDKLSTGLSILQWVQWIVNNSVEWWKPNTASRISKRLNELLQQYSSF